MAKKQNKKKTQEVGQEKSVIHSTYVEMKIDI